MARRPWPPSPQVRRARARRASSPFSPFGLGLGQPATELKAEPGESKLRPEDIFGKGKLDWELDVKDKPTLVLFGRTFEEAKAAGHAYSPPPIGYLLRLRQSHIIQTDGPSLPPEFRVGKVGRRR